MNVLFLGDIVGAEATKYVAGRLPGLRRALSLDLVVANAENCAVTGPSIRRGFGMTTESVGMLLDSGVDAITSGNHAWDGPEAENVLEHPRVLRPLNMPDALPGKGILKLEIGGGWVTIVNLMSASAVPEREPVYRSWLPEGEAGGVKPLYPAWLSASREGAVIVDLHGLTVSEKQAFAFAVDGEAAAVLGTHTHEPTLPLRILPKGTALVTDVGMTGRTAGVIGIEPDHLVAELTGAGAEPLPPFRLAGGSMTLGAVALRIEGRGTTSLFRVS
jgi:metallophosphoesterase (TIGR00282 family)